MLCVAPGWPETLYPSASALVLGFVDHQPQLIVLFLKIDLASSSCVYLCCASSLVQAIQVFYHSAIFLAGPFHPVFNP